MKTLTIQLADTSSVDRESAGINIDFTDEPTYERSMK